MKVPQTAPWKLSHLRAVDVALCDGRRILATRTGGELRTPIRSCNLRSASARYRDSVECKNQRKLAGAQHCPFRAAMKNLATGTSAIARGGSRPWTLTVTTSSSRTARGLSAIASAKSHSQIDAQGRRPLGDEETHDAHLDCSWREHTIVPRAVAQLAGLPPPPSWQRTRRAAEKPSARTRIVPLRYAARIDEPCCGEILANALADTGHRCRLQPLPRHQCAEMANRNFPFRLQSFIPTN